AAAIAYVVMPEAFTTESGSARVVDEGIAIGQLALDRKGYDYPLPFWQNRPATSVCMNVDSEAVRQNFLQTIIDHHIR
ncbi:MAG: purine nucleosidase, partial [bacterium]